MSLYCNIHYAHGGVKTYVFMEPVLRVNLRKSPVTRLVVFAVAQVNATQKHILASEQDAVKLVSKLAEDTGLKLSNSYLSISKGYFNLVIDFAEIETSTDDLDLRSA